MAFGEIWRVAFPKCIEPPTTQQKRGKPLSGAFGKKPRRPLPAGSFPGVKLKPNPIQLILELCVALRREVLLHEVLMGDL